MFPFFVHAPTYEYPLSGDVVQSISPTFSTEFEGIPEVEYEVYTTVASPGTQLGKLTEAVLALADKIGLEGEEVEAVRKLAKGVGDAKLSARDKVRDRADRMAERAEKLERLGEG